jgi:tetratricopeptide (TPR) repeat protein
MLAGLAMTEQAQGNHDRALALMQESVALVDDGVVQIDGIQRGNLYQLLGDQLNWATRNREAEDYMRKAIAEYEKAGGPDHPYVADGKRALGMLIAWWGRREEARALLQSAFDAQQRVRGEDDPQLTAVIRLDLGRVLLMRGEYAEGERHLQRVIGLWRVSGQSTVNALIQLGRLHTEQGRFDLAARDLAGIDEAAAKTHGPGSWIHATALNRLGSLSLAQGQRAEARRWFERCDREAKDVQGLSPNRAYARAGLLKLAIDAGDPRAADKAKELLSQIESARTRMDMPDEEAAAHLLLGVALLRAGQAREAQPHLEKALEMRARMDAPGSPLLAETKLYLAQQRHAVGQVAEAHRLVTEAGRALASQRVAPQFHSLLSDTARRIRSRT